MDPTSTPQPRSMTLRERLAVARGEVIERPDPAPPEPAWRRRVREGKLRAKDQTWRS